MAKTNPHYRIRSPGAVVPDTLHGILNDLAKLNFNQDKAVLGDIKNVEARHDDHIASKAPQKEKEVINVSSESETSGNNAKPPVFTETKAKRIMKLVQRATQATDNEALSKLVGDFVEALQCNRSRILTREASLFLDALCKQLEDPSVFIVAVRLVRCLEGQSALQLT